MVWVRKVQAKNETTKRKVGSSLATPSISGLLLYFSIFIRAPAAAPTAAAPTLTALFLPGLAVGCCRRRRCRLSLLLLQCGRLLLLLRVAFHVSAAALHLVEHPEEAHTYVSIGLSYSLLPSFSERASAAPASSV